MHIFINEEPVDIVIEEEKTIGDVLAGIDAWLSESENRISGLRINDEPICLSAMTKAFEQSLEHIDSLNITVSTWDSLAVEALLDSQEALSFYTASSFNDKAQIKKAWEESAAARFLSKYIPDTFALLAKTLAGEANAAEMAQALDERIREFTDTNAETRKLAKLISSLAKRLEELPLDIQTAQDRKVAETVNIFSLTVDKLLRLIRILRIQDVNVMENVAIDNQPFSLFIENFTALLGEFLAAYEANDVVLLGDLAEYELSPRLLKLYTAMGSIIL
ncbi:MAG: hypothetical protein LBF87_07120 [Treponema sp.]|jgi:hypothetical protein|nr:hypothetical protein [Treponema sp.]